MASDQNSSINRDHPATPHQGKPNPTNMINLGYVALDVALAAGVRAECSAAGFTACLGLSVVFPCLGSGLRCDTDMVAWHGFTPDVARRVARGNLTPGPSQNRT